MTPFEKAAYNVKQLAIRLSLYQLMLQTVEDTKDLDEKEADLVWEVILAMLEASDLGGEIN
tara:strand:+ start:807 stop:989 length:183 start_codon:yes stop_codon:yes gene_type:complete